MSKKILLVVDEVPFPPRNGLTIPVCKLIESVSDFCEIDLAILDKCNPIISIKLTQTYAKAIYRISMRNPNVVVSVLQDFFCVRPYFSRHRISPGALNEIPIDEYDVIVISPIWPSYYIDLFRRHGKKNAIYISLINDCYSATLKSYFNLVLLRGVGTLDRMRFFVNFLRSSFVKITETAILKKFNTVVVQTEKDKSAVCRGGLSNVDDVAVITNGVDDKFFDSPPKNGVKTIGFIGDLSGWEIRRDLLIFLQDIWPSLASKGYTCTLTGKCSDEVLLRKICESNKILHREYVDDPVDIFSSLDVLIVPNYRALGIINRTIQAMASNVIVIGHVGAFHSIPGFEDGKHGFVIKNISEVENIIDSLSMDEFKSSQVRGCARTLMNESFRWSTSIAKWRRLIVDSGR